MQLATCRLAVPGRTNRRRYSTQLSPYLKDLEATNGTFLNDVQIDAARYYQLKKGDVLIFGASMREHIVLTAIQRPSTDSVGMNVVPSDVSGLVWLFIPVRLLLFQRCSKRETERTLVVQEK